VKTLARRVRSARIRAKEGWTRWRYRFATPSLDTLRDVTLVPLGLDGPKSTLGRYSDEIIGSRFFDKPAGTPRFVLCAPGKRSYFGGDLFVLDRRKIFYDLGIDDIHLLSPRNVEILVDGFHGRGIRRLGGVGCYISNNVLTNYNHWMFAALPMLHYCRSSGYEPDWVYANASALPPHVAATLERAGFPRTAIITEPCSGDVNVMTLRDWRFGERPESFAFVRNLYADALRKNPARSSRIYVRRGKVPNRNMKNTEEIDRLLNTRYGMEPVVMDGLRIEEQAEIFFNADVVVAPHGAALTNLIFSKPGTVVIELCSPNYLQGDIKDMARTTNLRHMAIVGEVGDGPSLNHQTTFEERFAARGADYTVPVSKLIAALESAGAA
jgi:hypothetical protein